MLVVNTRNVSQLLNIVAPCSVTEFKDAGLEYLCLQLEAMLENHLLDDLDEDLLLELDEVVRANQLNCLPFAKSGRAEMLLHERHPGLAGEIDEERQRRIRDMAFRENLKDDDSRLSTSFRARVGSLDDFISGSPSQEKARRKSKQVRNAPFSPSIRPKDSTMDLMFDMDDDDPLGSGSPNPSALKTVSGITPVAKTGPESIPAHWDELESNAVGEEPSSLPSRAAGFDIQPVKETPPSAAGTKIWSSPALPSKKLDMREIMAQASSSRTSNLSMSLSAQKVKDDAGKKMTPQKLSQKERKKQQQQQAIAQAQMASEAKPSSPWQIAATGKKTSLKDVLSEPKPSPAAVPAPTFASPIPSRPSTPRRTASPDTRFSGQQRRINNPIPKGGISSAGPASTSQTVAKSSPLVPHSKTYTTPAAKAEPSLQLSMADIIGQQRREQEVIKEAVAKRSLQEIQEEQAFQEWWDQESKRAQEAEALRASATAGAFKGGKAGSGRGKGGSRGRGGRGRGDTARSGRGRGQERGSSGIQ